MSDQELSASEWELAWHTRLEVATRTPFLGLTPGRDPDCLVGEAVYDSLAVYTALHSLAAGITADSALVPTLLPALMCARRLLALRTSWTGYCNERFGLDPAVSDARSEMSRQYVAGDDVRGWPQFDEAKAAHGEAAAAVGAFVQVLEHLRACHAEAGGTDAAKPGLRERPALRLVSGLDT
ncbi:hypothetical protein [Streptomyces sp. NPDC048638]|uniref:hypothetical protein n=1 Tax=Streptomyces sp. NPDC048638 TaxID=3365580 RepID=UPI003722BF5E